MRAVAATLLLIVLAGLGVACGDGDEPAELARQALEHRGIAEVEIDFDPDTRVVRLRGMVATDEVRQHAEESVRAAVGPTATVSNEILVEGVRAGAIERSNERARESGRR